MAKTYRTIKFVTPTETLSIDIRIENEEVVRNEISSIFESASGKRYKTITGSNENYKYRFDYCDSEVYDFFIDAYAETSLTFERELDDGTYDSFEAFISRPQYQDENVDNTGEKVYRDLRVEVFSA